MAVLTQVQLPDQPSDGSVVYTPLGGNGFQAPHSMFDFSVQATGDASGGNVVLQLFMDPRFVSLVNWVSGTGNPATGDIGNAMSLTTNEGSGVGISDYSPATQAAALSVGAAKTWQPPCVPVTNNPVFTPVLSCTFTNSNGREFNFTGQILLFDKRARETTPLFQMAANLVRST